MMIVMGYSYDSVSWVSVDVFELSEARLDELRMV